MTAVPSAALAVALLAATSVAAGPVPKGATPPPAGPPPQLLLLRPDATGQLPPIAGTKVEYRAVKQAVMVLKDGAAVTEERDAQVPTATQVRVTLAELAGKLTTADGAAITPDAVAARAADGLAVLVSADGKPVHPGWLKAVAPDTVVVTTEALAGASLHLYPGPNNLPTVPARLSILGADPAGRPTLPLMPVGRGDVIQDQLAGQVAARQVVVNNGAVLNVGPGVETTRPPLVEPAARVLADVPFDAYELDGRPVLRESALKRLAAGGVVLVAAGSQLPDPAFRRVLRGEVPVLVGPHLRLPSVTGQPPAGGVWPGAPAGVQLQFAPVVPAAPVRVLPAPRGPAVVK